MSIFLDRLLFFSGLVIEACWSQREIHDGLAENKQKRTIIKTMKSTLVITNYGEL